jgi:hypothetical protein
MPHFEGVQLRSYTRALPREPIVDARRSLRRSLGPPERQMEMDKAARERAVKQYRKVAECIDYFMRNVRQRIGGGGDAADWLPEEDPEKTIVLGPVCEESLRELMKQIVRDLRELRHNIEIIDEQLTLFARARDRLDFRHGAATGTRTAFLRDISLMTGELPDEPYMPSDDIITTCASIQIA